MTSTVEKLDRALSNLTVRKMPFEFPDDLQPHWNKDKPEWSHMVNGASLAMPYLEPYLIRTMRKALAHIDDEQLKQEVKLYMAQEGQHFQQHRKFNDTLFAHGYEELKVIEDQMEADYKRFESEKPLAFNLAYAAGFETMALGVGHWLIKDREYLFGGSDTRVASLILWHFVEEIEHKNVALDAYNAVVGKHWYRVYMMTFATLHIIKYSIKAYRAMLKKDGLLSKLSSRWRLLKMIGRFYKAMLPPFFEACLPSHHPSKIPDPEWSDQWVEQYDANQNPLATLDTQKLHNQPS